MADITPSPTADGPFSLATPEVHADIQARATKLGMTNPRLAELAAQDKSFHEITRTLYEEANQTDTAGTSLNV
jgi:hypothetical protein